jgi:transposase
MYPTQKYFLYYGTPEPSRQLPTVGPISCKSIGASYIVSHILANLGVDRVLEDVFGAEETGSILSIAEYMVCRGNVMERIGDWCEGHSLGCQLKAQDASLIFSSITHDGKMDFFKAWLARNNAGDFLAYDVTSFSTYAKKIEEAEWGYNRDGDKMPQINMGHYFSYQTGLPMFYVTYPGSITDKSYLSYLIIYNNELAIKDPVIIMDRGFCSTANIQALHADNIRYVIMVDSFHKTTLSAINEVKNNIKSISNVIKAGLFGKTIHSRFYGARTDMHVFYNRDLEERHEMALFRRIELKADQLKKLKTITPKEAKNFINYYIIKINNNGTFTYTMNFEKIDEIASNNGFYCIISNTKFDIADVNTIYRRRDNVEKIFDDIKNFADLKRLSTHNDSTTGGKLFCAFIAMIAAAQMTEKVRILNKIGGHRRWSKDNLVSELEKIKVFKLSDGSLHLMNPLTKTQRDVFTAFGTSENELKNFVGCQEF